MGTEAEMSTLLRRRGLLIELDRRRRIDAYDRQFTGCRSAGVHVELDMIAPWVGSAGRSPAMQDATGQNGAGRGGEWGGLGRAGSRRYNCPGHDGGRERTRAWL